MATKVTHHCDMCSAQLTYHDADGDEHQAGIFVRGEVEIKVHQRNSSGSSSWYCDSIGEGEYCSHECWQKSVLEALEDTVKFKPWKGE